MNFIKSSCNIICKPSKSQGKETINNYLRLKSVFRGLWSSYFNFRYLNVFSKPNKGEVYKYSFDQWRHPTSPLLFQESKFNDLFEFASKSRYLSSSLLAVDLVELTSSIDSYKEGYPFTTAYVKFSKIIDKKAHYTHGLSGYLLEEVENCFKFLEEYCKVYEAITLLSSFAEEIKLFIRRLSIYGTKPTFKAVISNNKYDTKERLHSDLKVLLQDYKYILDNLKDYPLWQEKFESDVSKLFAFSNIVFDVPEIYELVDRQKIFK